MVVVMFCSIIFSKEYEPSFGEQDLGHGEVCLLELLLPHVQHGRRGRDLPLSVRGRLAASVSCVAMARLVLAVSVKPVSNVYLVPS